MRDDPLEGDALLRAMFEASAIGIALVGSDGRPLRCNPALERFLGYSEEELVTMAFTEFTHPDDIAADVELTRQLRNGERSAYTMEKRYVRKDGRIVWGRLAASLAQSPVGLVAIGMVEDITEARASRARSEELFDALAERIKQQRALHACARVLSQMSLPLEQLLAEVARLLPPAFQDPERTSAYFRLGREVYATEGHDDDRVRERLEATFVTAEGERGELVVAYHAAPPSTATPQLPSHLFEVFLPEERALLQSFAEMLRGELDRRSAERALRRSRERLELALSAGDMGVWELDVATNRVTWSDQVSKFVGRDGDTLGAYRAFASFIHPDDREQFLTSIDALVVGTSRSDRVDMELRLAKPDGGYRLVAFHGTAHRVDGKVTRVIGVVANITNRRRLETHLRQTQKMEALGRLAGGVAHDFNNLLSVMSASSALLLEELADDDPRRELAVDIAEAANRSAVLTRQLLAFSRTSSVQASAVDVAVAFVKLQPLLERMLGPSVRLEPQIDPNAGLVWAEPAQVDQIILNLALNARDAMPGGGQVTIRIDSAVVDERYVESHPDAVEGRHIRIVVSDTGTGIAPDLLPRIFEPFFTTKEPDKGTGLGLAVVFGIVRQCRGHIIVESEPGRGTTFQVLLPVAPESRKADTGAPLPPRL